jgi:hypothetical protein
MQDKAAAALGVSRLQYTLAGGRRGTAGLTPAEIEEKAQSARDRGRTTQVFICKRVFITNVKGTFFGMSESEEASKRL